MNYVKHFDINGVDTKQVACIELHGKPNAATEGCVGVLGVDVDSPTHDVYKCVAVNGSIYTWELLSSGMSIMVATISGGGAASAKFPYTNLLTPAMYVLKKGDLILDSEAHLYQIEEINTTYCGAKYTGSQFCSYAANGIHIGENAPTKGELLWLDTDDYPGESGDGESVDSPIVDVIAKAGQVIAVKAVDEEGKPLEYHGVDLPVIPEIPKAVTPDFAANEGDAGHILNRTHYVDEKGIIHKLDNKFIDADWMATKIEEGGDVFYAADIEFTSGYVSLANYGGGFKVDPGFELNVYWNGVRYKCTVKLRNDEPYIGNGSLVYSDVEDTGEPFCLYGVFLAPDVICYAKKDNADAESVTCIVTLQVVEYYNKLPKEYLPDEAALKKDIPDVSDMVKSFYVNISAGDSYSCSTPISTLDAILDANRLIVAKITTDTGALFAPLCSYETSADNSYGRIVMFALGILTFTLTPTASGFYEVTVSGD